MRSLCTTTDKEIIRSITQALDEMNIAYSLEGKTNSDWGSDTYGETTFHLWIIEETQYEEAKEISKKIIADPLIRQKYFIPLADSSSFKSEHSSPTDEVAQKYERKLPQWSTHPATVILIFILSFVYLWQVIAPEETLHLSSPSGTDYFVYRGRSYPERILLYDYPKAWQLYDSAVSQFNSLNSKEPESWQVKAVTQNLLLAHQTPYWRGFYSYIHSKEDLKSSIHIPRFEKTLKQKQLWRLITPSLLHGSWLHFIFNLMWAIILLPVTEEIFRPLSRRGVHFFIFLCVLALFSNTAQYIMSGANFLGFSGVIAGVAGYLFSRMRTLPDELRQKIDVGGLIFLRAFIYVSAFISLVNFLFGTIGASEYAIPFEIANTAHLVGWWTGRFIGNKENLLLIKR